jgi:hypothetical protein
MNLDKNRACWGPRLRGIARTSLNMTRWEAVFNQTDLLSSQRLLPVSGMIASRNLAVAGARRVWAASSATSSRTRTLASTAAMLASDGASDPGLHIFNGYTRRLLCFTFSFLRGGNGGPNVFQRVRTSYGNNQPAFGIQAPDQVVPGMKAEQLKYGFGNGELFFAGESAFRENLHSDLNFVFPSVAKSEVGTSCPQPYPLFFCSTPR